MTNNHRRDFLKMAGIGAFGAAMSSSIERALALPANRKTGTIEDVEHIVILTQENRSFDHYFGTLRGVRGFDDPRAAKLSTGRSVWHQPDASTSTGYVLPFRPDDNFGKRFMADVEHGWNDSHDAWNSGQYDKWSSAKNTGAMTYYIRKDIPYHFALADAFTICDHYFCSLMGPTDPNRYHMWTGWVGNDGKGGGPVITNAEAGYDWSTFPERLVKAGIGWKVYQDVGVGLDGPGYWGWTGDPYIGNYGDNSLLYFHQYQNAPDGSPLALAARTGTNIAKSGTLFDQLRADVAADKLPQISYIAAPETYSEHPNWIPNFGAWYIWNILEILISNPTVWSKTVFLINYDEAGGIFDHIVPPAPPVDASQGKSTVSTVNEIFPGYNSGGNNFVKGPYGLGTRVPLFAISPWSKGGWVNSEVFDHTSVIKFIEKRFAKTHPELHETNITPWRRAVTGDLTSIFDFANPNTAIPKLPSAAKYAPKDHSTKYPDFVPVVPAHQKMPVQEPGLRYARAIPYRYDANATVDTAAAKVTIAFADAGSAHAVYMQVRSAGKTIAPKGYTVGPSKLLTDTWSYKPGEKYDLSVHGANGFFRQFRGVLSATAAKVTVATAIDHAKSVITFTITNRGTKAATVRLTNGYTNRAISHLVGAGAVWSHLFDANDLSGWYDVLVTLDGDAVFLQHFAGHIEDGSDSISDPAIGMS